MRSLSTRMNATRPLPVHRPAWALCSAVVFFLCSVYLLDWPMTLLVRLAVLAVVAVGAISAGWVLQFGWALSDGIRAKRLVLAALLLISVGICGGYLGRNIIMRQYDAMRLASFAHRIAETDRVVAGCVEDRSIRLTFAGDAAKRVVGAVSSGASARLPDAEFTAAYDVVATFYRGTTVLGRIELSSSLFLLGSNDPPFASDALENLVYTPVLEALRESYSRQTERQ